MCHMVYVVKHIKNMHLLIIYIDNQEANMSSGASSSIKLAIMQRYEAHVVCLISINI